MILFCFLWMPLFYLFWRSLNDRSSLEGGTWALILGAVLAFFRFFLGSFINAGGFGFSRWVSACIDYVALPVALPYAVCLVFAAFRLISTQSNFTNIAFLWLIPVAAGRFLGWSSQNDPILLMAVPVLWTAVTLGMGFFVQIIQNGFGPVMIPAALGAAVLPLIGATSYWAFFGQRNTLGFLLFGVCLVPMLVSLVKSFLDAR
jgi:hypothetical protein